MICDATAQCCGRPRLVSSRMVCEGLAFSSWRPRPERRRSTPGAKKRPYRSRLCLPASDARVIGHASCAAVAARAAARRGTNPTRRRSLRSTCSTRAAWWNAAEATERDASALRWACCSLIPSATATSIRPCVAASLRLRLRLRAPARMRESTATSVRCDCHRG